MYTVHGLFTIEVTRRLHIYDVGYEALIDTCPESAIGIGFLSSTIQKVTRRSNFYISDEKIVVPKPNVFVNSHLRGIDKNWNLRSPTATSLRFHMNKLTGDYISDRIPIMKELGFNYTLGFRRF